MKKTILSICSVFIGVIIITSIIVFATRDFNLMNSSANNANPEVLYKQNNSIDFLVFKDTAFVNATDIDWVSELELKSDIKIGEIKRTNRTKKFKDFDATVLKVGIEIYSVLGRADFVLVNIDGILVPYYAFVEG